VERESKKVNSLMERRRLSKTLAAAGIVSRREAESLIFSGKVKVNGEVVCIPQVLVNAEEDRIEVGTLRIKEEEEKVYFMLNKPKGFICSNREIGRKRLVKDLFSSLSLRLFTVGRLDRDTTGLLLVTNDGHFSQRVIHPSSNLTKEYLVKTVEEIEDQHLISCRRGRRIEGDWVRPVRVSKMRSGTLKIGIKEGKKREVRLLVQGCGLTLLSLTRIRIGGLVLGPLREGEWSTLTLKQRESIFQSSLK